MPLTEEQIAKVTEQATATVRVPAELDPSQISLAARDAFGEFLVVNLLGEIQYQTAKEFVGPWTLWILADNRIVRTLHLDTDCNLWVVQ